MRFHPVVNLFAFTFLTSCAHEGVIVRKDSTAQPFYQSVGVDGSYSFMLRDNAGSIHRQLVTPEVFERYALGQYFNDLQPATTGAERSGDKEMKTASTAPSARPHAAIASAASKPGQVAIAKKLSSARHTVAKHHQAHKAVAKHAPGAVTKKKVIATAKPQPVAPPARPTLLVAVARCR